MRGALQLAALLLAAAAVFADPAVPCNETLCSDLTVCRCSSTNIPGGLDAVVIPHFVVLSFDDNVNVLNKPFYEEIAQKINPNGCNIKMTFFVSHESNDYTLVNELYRSGHEIGVHSITHKSDVQNYWRNLTQEGWSKEIVQMKEMLVKYGNIPADSIKGFRAPFLEVGGDVMYQALDEAGFEYDCSWPSLKYTPWYQDQELGGKVAGALWPYTLDYMSVQDKTVGTPPTESIPGLWVSPMTDMQDNRGFECSMLDACQSADDELETSAAAVKDLLRRNFNAHTNSRTPFGIYVHHSWFADQYPARKQGFQDFLDYLSAYPEVYVVTVSQLLEWVKNPVPFDEVGTLDAFKCPSAGIDRCPSGNHKNCPYEAPLPIASQEVFMKICESPCPDNYPYLDNVDGNNPY